MLITLFRTIILYVIIIFSVRVMGKRQVGELQPSELVITIMISNIAAIPLQDNSLPLMNSIVALLLLVSLEVVLSFVILKNHKFRSIMQGHPLIIIRDGKINQKLLKEMRFTVDDILEALREKDVFDISQVQYAIIETTGMISVLLKPQEQPTTAKMVNYQQEDTGFPYMVISDGKIVETYLDDCHTNIKDIQKLVGKKGMKISDIFIMTIDKQGNSNIIRKENKK